MPPGDFFDLERPDPSEDFLWNSGESLLGVALLSYFAYPAVSYTIGALPGPNSVEGGYFFSFLSIVYGTLTSATISDATVRLAALREAIVEECSLMLPLLERLRITLLERGLYSEHREDRERVYSACATQLWFHVTDIISGTREIELELLSTREYDPLVNIVGALQRAQYRWGTSDLDFGIERTEEVITVRGRWLQLEGSGIPAVQFGLLRGLAGLLALTYTYLTLDRPEGARYAIAGGPLAKVSVHADMLFWGHTITTAPPATTTLLGLNFADGVGVIDSTLGVRILFAMRRATRAPTSWNLAKTTIAAGVDDDINPAVPWPVPALSRQECFGPHLRLGIHFCWRDFPLFPGRI